VEQCEEAKNSARTNVVFIVWFDLGDKQKGSVPNG